MDPQQIRELFTALKLELIAFKEWYIAIFIIVSSAILAIGLVWPQTYQASAVLHADVTNIIESTDRTRRPPNIDRSQTARDVIYTRQFVEDIARQAGLIDSSHDSLATDSVVGQLRGAISIQPESKDYFRIGFSSADPDNTFNVLNITINAFINHTAKQKKDDSYQRYTFLDSQVQAYRSQLEEKERELKDFKAANVEGTEASVDARISSLRNDIESLNLSIEENQSRVKTTQDQLDSESGFLHARSQLKNLEERKSILQGNLENLRLTYQDNYPDIVTLKSQIKNIDEQISKIYEAEGLSSGGNSSENPLFEELRKQLSASEADLRAQNQRMASLERLLQQEYGRRQKVAENEAVLTELTRDFDVIRDAYDDMLGQKEGARLAVALSNKGQGVTYRIHEPAIFPLRPSGLKPIHFVFIGPILGLLLPLGLVIAYIVLDPRIRSYSSLERQFSDTVDVIGYVPHTSTAISKRILRHDVVVLLGVLLLFAAIYTVVVVQKIIGQF